MEFVVNNRKIQVVIPEVLIADNADYIAEFAVDKEWEGKIITARFVGANGYVDRILDENLRCNVPTCALQGNVKVGLYTDTMATTTVAVSVENSIKTGTGAPATPSEDVYFQLLEIIGGVENGSY